ncbi:MAG TPA: IS1182 family transposase [Chloroflexota bacterium]|nr:IS1182 family transposase [Chloroflexota bacterium]
MQPPLWQPPVEPSVAEQAILARIRRAKLFSFLRQQRHHLFSASFQEELAATYQESPFGQPPIPPAQLALATILQAYTGVSDDEVIEATVMDRRWQLVLDCLECERPPFSIGTLVAFRARLIEHELDRRLVERTVEVAAQRGGFSARQLRAALDSSPLWGAGRVEATYNLLGHALKKALGVLARQQGRGLAEIAAAAGASLVGGSSLKAALDLNWDDPAERAQALVRVLDALTAVETWLDERAAPADPDVAASLAAAHQVQAQDTTTSADGTPVLRQGVAPDRRISLEDGEMRHGRKSRSHLIDGFKRHVVRDLDSRLVPAVGLTAANVPEAAVGEAIRADLAAQTITLAELHIDRAYLSSVLVQERPADLAIYCKAWPVHNGTHFPKTAFVLDWEQGTIRCPNQVVLPFQPGETVQFPAATCAACPLRDRCTSSAQGRSVTIHLDERLLAELRERQLTSAGRAKLRERVGVEHTLAHIGHWQGDRARYWGVRKNLFDLRRCAVVHNLHVIAHWDEEAKAA